MLHFLVIWQIREEDQTAAETLRSELREILVGESFAQVFEDTYIVRVGAPEERIRLNTRFLAKAQEGNNFWLIITPASAEEVGYTGWLPSATWLEVERKARPSVALAMEARDAAKKNPPPAPPAPLTSVLQQLTGGNSKPPEPSAE